MVNHHAVPIPTLQVAVHSCPPEPARHLEQAQPITPTVSCRHPSGTSAAAEYADHQRPPSGATACCAAQHSRRGVICCLRAPTPQTVRLLGARQEPPRLCRPHCHGADHQPCTQSRQCSYGPLASHGVNPWRANPKQGTRQRNQRQATPSRSRVAVVLQATRGCPELGATQHTLVAADCV